LAGEKQRLAFSSWHRAGCTVTPDHPTTSRTSNSRAWSLEPNANR